MTTQVQNDNLNDIKNMNDNHDDKMMKERQKNGF